MKKKSITVPDREPDFILGPINIWWKEKIQTNNTIPKKIFILEYRKNGVYFKNSRIKDDSYFNLFYGDDIFSAYKKWLISNALKEKLSEKIHKV